MQTCLEEKPAFQNLRGFELLSGYHLSFAECGVMSRNRVINSEHGAHMQRGE